MLFRSVYIDNVLVHTGTSWENYYRYDSEASAEQSPRITKTVIFRTGGAPAPATAGFGYLVDNLKLSSGPVKDKNDNDNRDECKKDDKKDTDSNKNDSKDCHNNDDHGDHGHHHHGHRD